MTTLYRDSAKSATPSGNRKLRAIPIKLQSELVETKNYLRRAERCVKVFSFFFWERKSGVVLCVCCVVAVYCVYCWCWGFCFFFCGCCERCSFEPSLDHPMSDRPAPHRSARNAKNFAMCLPSRCHFVLFLSLGGSFRWFLVVFLKAETFKCTRSSSRVVVWNHAGFVPIQGSLEGYVHFLHQQIRKTKAHIDRILINLLHSRYRRYISMYTFIVYSQDHFVQKT